MRYYTKRDLSSQAVLEALELITEICDCLQNKKHMKRVALSLEIPHYTIHVLEVGEHLQLLSEGSPKEELATKDSTRYIRVINNRSVEWFSRHLGTCGD